MKIKWKKALVKSNLIFHFWPLCSIFLLLSVQCKKKQCKHLQNCLVANECSICFPCCSQLVLWLDQTNPVRTLTTVRGITGKYPYNKRLQTLWTILVHNRNYCKQNDNIIQKRSNYFDFRAAWHWLGQHGWLKKGGVARPTIKY